MRVAWWVHGRNKCSNSPDYASRVCEELRALVDEFGQAAHAFAQVLV